MKTTDRKTLRPTAGADRPGDTSGRHPEARPFAARPVATSDRAGLFTGGATLH